MVSKSKILGKPSLIFVTIGTTNFPHNRLFIAVDNALQSLGGEERLIVQTGKSSYVWKYKNIQQYQYIKPKKMISFFSKANKIITHGGFGTLFMLSTASKNMPLIVARRNQNGEHINNHQSEFIIWIKKKLPPTYKKYFLLQEQIQKEVREYLQSANSNNLLHNFLFKSNGSILGKLNNYLNNL